MGNWYANCLSVQAPEKVLDEIFEFVQSGGDPAWTDIYCEGNEVRFRTPHLPDVDTIDWIAETFPQAEFWYTYYDTIGFSCVGIKYKNGKILFETCGHFGPDLFEEECIHPFNYYEEDGTHRLFYEIEGNWTEVTAKT